MLSLEYSVEGRSEKENERQTSVSGIDPPGVWKYQYRPRSSPDAPRSED